MRVLLFQSQPLHGGGSKFRGLFRRLGRREPQLLQGLLLRRVPGLRARHIVDECYDLDRMMGNLANYFDYAAYSRELFMYDCYMETVMCSAIGKT